MGYAFTLNYSGPDFSANKFNPGLGQGPVGILPVALAIKVFGASPITSGLTQVVLEFILLFLVAFSLISLYKTNRIPMFFISSLLLITLISGLHYEHWYAMLGESIAALLILCGYLVWAKHGQSQRSGFEAGLCFGLAVLTKEISAIFVIAFIFYVVWQLCPSGFKCRQLAYSLNIFFHSQWQACSLFLLSNPVN
jgi:4-amino-4-deoxy-L-arabinose transferase-like glycosyltransferase